MVYGPGQQVPLEAEEWPRRHTGVASEMLVILGFLIKDLVITGVCSVCENSLPHMLYSYDFIYSLMNVILQLKHPPTYASSHKMM